MLHFKSITEITDYFGLKAPKHPLFLSHRPSREEIAMAHQLVDSTPIKSEFYTVSLKRIIRGSITYGKTKYDCEKGVLLFVAPGQISEAQNAEFEYGGFTVIFHQDFLVGHRLSENIKRYHFFEYTANEALHLLPKEEQTLQGIYDNIEAEYQNNQDEFSKEIILSHLETLLKYSDRYYKRQFLYRERLNSPLLTKFLDLLHDSFDNNSNTTLTLDWCAAQLKVTKRYLSESIRAESGKTAKDNLNMFLVEKARNLLLVPGVTVSEIAYRLGFEYPEYFSRVFKKKTGISPKQFIKSYSNN